MDFREFAEEINPYLGERLDLTFIRSKNAASVHSEMMKLLKTYLTQRWIM